MKIEKKTIRKAYVSLDWDDPDVLQAVLEYVYNNHLFDEFSIVDVEISKSLNSYGAGRFIINAERKELG